MPDDIIGNYTLPPIYQATTGEVILAVQHNTPLEDVQSALSLRLSADGRKAMAGDLKMGGFKVTGGANGILDTDLATVGQMSAAVALAMAAIPELSFDTITQLRAFSSATTITTAEVSGGAAVNDGLGSRFYKDATDTTSADDGYNVIVDSFSTPRRWKRIISAENRYPSVNFLPLDASRDVDYTVSWPKARFGLDWPAGVADAGNSIYVFTGSGNYYMGLFRSLYGTALEEVVRASDGYNFIANLGVSTGQYQYGGASLQTALFDYNENLPTAPYEEDNPIESHGFRDDGLTPVVLAPNPPSMAAPQARKLLITGRYGKWFSSVYRGNRAAATAAGATHNEFSDVMGQKTYEWENIGCNNSPFTMANVNVCNLALRRDNPKQMRGIDILTGYHRKSTMGQVWSYDPRAAASARMYPNQSDNLVIDAIALTNKVLASGLAAGQTITAPDGTVITLTVGMKVLLQNQTTVAENGVVTITAGVPTYLGSPPTQVSSPKWGQYTNTAVSTWVRTYNYTSLPIIFTDTTTHAFGIWSPQIPLTGEGSNTSDGAGIGQYNIQDYGSAKDMNGWEAQIHGVQNGARYLMDRNILRFKAVFAVGTYAEVKTALQGTWNQWGKVLRPSYFDYTYLQANVRGLETWTEDQIRLWWLCRGANQGVIAKSGATITGGLSPTANYNFWRDAP